MRLVNALNEVHINVWAIVIMVGGIVLTCCKQPIIGGTLVTGSFALIQKSDKKEVSNA